MKHYVYCIEYKDGSYYIGATNNIERRIRQHGKANEWFILEETDEKSIWLLEIMWIQLFNSWNFKTQNSPWWKGRGKAEKGDKKKAITVYLPTSVLLTIGREKLKEIATEAIEREYKKMKK